LVQENKAKVVLAEAEVPMAISQAFREGRFVVALGHHGSGNPRSDTQAGNTVAGSGRGDREAHNQN
jgi:uncharacterized protein YqfA (UPF0365 family)